MAALRAEEGHAAALRSALAKRSELAHRPSPIAHMGVRRRADALTLESGPEDDAAKHAGFLRVAVHLWILEIATHTAAGSQAVCAATSKISSRP